MRLTEITNIAREKNSKLESILIIIQHETQKEKRLDKISTI